MTYAHTLEHGIEEPIAIYLLQIAFILAMCRLCGFLVSFLKQPPVVGEIIAGILLGPSVMGQSESFSQFMFPKSSLPLLKGTATLGITLFMFILGLEFKPDAMMSSIRRTWFIGISGIALPFIFGILISPYLYDVTNMINAKPPVSQGSYKLFMGCCISFTAFPVLARILTSNHAMSTQIGLVSMAVASLDDVLAWTVLAVATSIQVGGDPLNALYALLITLAWIVFLIFIVSPCLLWAETKNMSAANYVFFVFCGMCSTAWLTEILGLHAFFGAFVFGICLPKGEETHNFIKQLEVLVINFFVPLFFATSGLSADLTTLSGTGAGPVIAVIILASGGKMLPCFFLGRCRGYSWRFSFQLASLMNARGLIALIALNIALSVRVFNVETYSILLIMALVTTFMAGPMFYFSYDPTIDPPFFTPAKGHKKYEDQETQETQEQECDEKPVAKDQVRGEVAISPSEFAQPRSMRERTGFRTGSRNDSCFGGTDVPKELQLKFEEEPHYEGYMFHRDLAPEEGKEVAQQPVEVPFFYPVVRVQSSNSLNPVVKTEGSPKKISPEKGRSQSLVFRSKKPARPESGTGTSNHAKVHFHTSSTNGLDGPERTALDGHAGVHFHTSSSNGLDGPGHTPLDGPGRTPLDGPERNPVVRSASARPAFDVPERNPVVRSASARIASDGAGGTRAARSASTPGGESAGSNGTERSVVNTNTVAEEGAVEICVESAGSSGEVGSG
eukprot:gb/GEZN01002699.1/.p1 GENE.gb/GEZN01002699.1/~~gb/GEZN01002699.1/.p1  ORF type:complete len:731 (+),score=46.46 gb/GEZN01002699.1/:97-2289(+)